MHDFKKIFLLLVLAAGVGVGPAAAADLAGRFGIFGDVGYGGFAMGGFNKEIDNANVGITAAGYNKVDPIMGGITAGGGVTYGLLANLQLGIEAQYLYAQSSYVQGGGSSYTSPSSPYAAPSMTPVAATGPAPTFNLYLPAIESGVLVRYLHPLSDMVMATGTLGLDDIYLYGSSKTDAETLNFTGNGLGGKLMLGLEAILSSHFSISGDAGYRLAKVNEIKDSSGRVLKLSSDSSQNLTADYSGLIVQGALRFYF